MQFICKWHQSFVCFYIKKNDGYSIEWHLVLIQGWKDYDPSLIFINQKKLLALKFYQIINNIFSKEIKEIKN